MVHPTQTKQCSIPKESPRTPPCARDAPNAPSHAAPHARGPLRPTPRQGQPAGPSGTRTFRVNNDAQDVSDIADMVHDLMTIPLVHMLLKVEIIISF